MTITYGEILMRLVLATALGAIIGYERESTNHYAGLRTHMLVSVSSALIGLGSLIIFEQYHEVTTMDPLRVSAQVISGIGFLGAGAILKHGSTISGLTTAASLWGIAAVGLFTGLGVIIPALMATSIIYLALALARYSDHVIKKKALLSIDIFAQDVIGQIGEIGSTLSDHGLSIKKINIENQGGNDIIIHLLVEGYGTKNLNGLKLLTTELQKAKGVKSINIE